MHNKNLPQDREELFCICFILELDKTASDYLLKRLTGQGIHYRNTKELVYAYCLRHGLSYEQAKQLADKLQPDTKTDHKLTQPLTEACKNKFQVLKNHEELLQFLLENSQCFLFALFILPAFHAAHPFSIF